MSFMIIAIAAQSYNIFRLRRQGHHPLGCNGNNHKSATQPTQCIYSANQIIHTMFKYRRLRLILQVYKKKYLGKFNSSHGLSVVNYYLKSKIFATYLYLLRVRVNRDQQGGSRRMMLYHCTQVQWTSARVLYVNSRTCNF